MSLQEIDWVSTIQQDLESLGEVFSTTASTTPRLIPGERRTVAVLFLDLKGFTAMSEQLDHETLHAITSSVMSRLSRTVEFHGGYVDKFEGDRIMALFGAEKAYENDCVRAVSCALKMNAEVQEFSDVLGSRGFSIGCRSGISYGDVTVAPDPLGHITATGDVVNTASRMEETAETGTVHVTGAVRDNAGEHFRWKDLGMISIRGKKEELHAFRPTGPGRKQLERWERARKLSSIPFVGRSSELEQLRGILHRQSGDDLQRNRRGGARHLFAVISGVAGIGKSRLMYEFMKSGETEADGTLILRAGCASYAQPPLLLILSLVRNWLFPGSPDLPPEEEVRSRLKALLSDGGTGSTPIRTGSVDNLAVLLSSGSTGLPSRQDLSADKAKILIQASISDLFRTLSGSFERLVVILDDVHWIDSASRECLEFLATGCDTDRPILFMLICRPEPAAGLDMFANLPEDYTIKTEIHLGEIDPESSRELIRSLLRLDSPSAPSEDAVEYILRESGGNAFFIEELVLGLTENGLLRQDASGRWELTASPESMVIPQSIKGLIRARADQLPDGPRRLLQLASVLGEEFNREDLFQVAMDTGIDTDGEGSLRELLARGFLNAHSENELLVRFHHVLVRDAVYETILRHNRRFLHSVCADALIRRVDNDPDLAGSITRHLSDAGEIEKAVPWGVRAQELAAERYDGEAVISWSNELEGWIRERLDTPDDARLLVDILNRRQIFEAYRLDSKRTETMEGIRELIEKWDLSDLRAVYLMYMGDMHRRSADFRGSVGFFREALELYRQAGDKRGIARAASSIAKSNSNLGLIEESVKDQMYAISLFRELGDIENIARSQFRLAGALLLGGRYDEALETLDEAIVHARKSGSRMVEANICGLRGVLQLEKRQYEDALRNQGLALAITRELGEKADELSALNSISNILYRMRRLDEARKYGLETLQASVELDNRRGEANVLCTMGLIELAEDNDTKALDYFRRSLEKFQKIGKKSSEAALHWNMSLTLFNLLRFEEGLEHGYDAIRLYREVGNRSRVASKLAYHAVTLVETGRTEEAEACLKEFETDFGDMADPRVHVQAIYARGYAALFKDDLEEAEGHFRAAIELAEGNGIKEYVAQSLLNIGLIRLRQENTIEAEDFLRRGTEFLNGTEYCRTYLPDAEYYLMIGDAEKARSFAKRAHARAEAAGNSRTAERCRKILKELGADPNPEG